MNPCFNDKMQNLPCVEDHFSVTNYFSENLISYSGWFLCYQHYNWTGTLLYTFGVIEQYFNISGFEKVFPWIVSDHY